MVGSRIGCCRNSTTPICLRFGCWDGGQRYCQGPDRGRQIRGNKVQDRFARDKEADNLLVCKAPLTIFPPISADLPSSES